MTNGRGSMLLELVIGAAVTCAVSAVLFQLATAAQAALAAQGNAADQQQRLRVAVEALRRDLLMAGAGPSRGAGRGPLIRVFPPVLPARIGVTNADPELTVRSDRISIVYVPETHAQTLLLSGMAAAASPLAIDAAAAACLPASACGFAAGDRALIYDPPVEGAAHEMFSVAAVDTARGLLTPSAPLSRPYAAGARVSTVVVRTYYLDAINKRLMAYDGDRSDVPFIDRLVDLQVGYLVDPRPDALLTLPLADLGGRVPKLLTDAQLGDGPFAGDAPNRFDADLLRVRRIRITLRVQSESPAGLGSDLEATHDVAPPNMAGR